MHPATDAERVVYATTITNGFRFRSQAIPLTSTSRLGVRPDYPISAKMVGAVTRQLSSRT